MPFIPFPPITKPQYSTHDAYTILRKSTYTYYSHPSTSFFLFVVIRFQEV